MASEDLFNNFSEEIAEPIDTFAPNTSVLENDADGNDDAEELLDDEQEISAGLKEVPENEAEVQPTEIPSKDKPNEPKLVQLPLNRIRNIIKLDPDVTIISSEAVFTIAKATELFIESLARESYSFTTQSKKKTILMRDVDLAIASIDSLMFLEGAMNF